MKHQAAGHLSTEWLNAYADDELSLEGREQVENHIAACEQCREELRQVKAVSLLLQEAPAWQARASRERFAAQVMLRLPRQAASQPSRARRAVKLLWQAAPVFILGAWATFQAFIFVLPLGYLLLGSVIPGARPSPWDLSGSYDSLLSALTSFNGLVDMALPLASIIGVELLLAMALAGLMWGWLASWWVIKKSVV